MGAKLIQYLTNKEVRDRWLSKRPLIAEQFDMSLYGNHNVKASNADAPTMRMYIHYAKVTKSFDKRYVNVHRFLLDVYNRRFGV
jgi:hypothetical protein